MGNEVTGAVGEDGAVTIGEGEAAVRYVKESDLLTVKGSRDTLQGKLDTIDKSQNAAITEAETKAETARQAALQAEATTERLTKEISDAGDNKEKVTSLTAERDAAIEAGKGTATQLLEMKQQVVIATFGVPKESVEGKTLVELTAFEVALKEVVGLKGTGNFAVGGAGGSDAGALDGLSPMELSRRGYASSNK